MKICLLRFLPAPLVLRAPMRRSHARLAALSLLCTAWVAAGVRLTADSLRGDHQALVEDDAMLSRMRKMLCDRKEQGGSRGMSVAASAADFARLLSPQGPAGVMRGGPDKIRAERGKPYLAGEATDVQTSQLGEAERETAKAEHQLKAFLASNDLKLPSEVVRFLSNMVRSEIKAAALPAQQKLKKAKAELQQCKTKGTGLASPRGAKPQKVEENLHVSKAEKPAQKQNCTKDNTQDAKLKKLKAELQKQRQKATKDQQKLKACGGDNNNKGTSKKKKKPTGRKLVMRVKKPKWSEEIKAWYIPSWEDPKVPLFGTINGSNMNTKCQGGKILADRSDAGMISVNNITKEGYINAYGMQALRELQYNGTAPNKQCKRWARGVIPTIVHKRVMVLLMQTLAFFANRHVILWGPPHKDLPSAQCCHKFSQITRNAWAEGDLVQDCCVKNRATVSPGYPYRAIKGNALQKLGPKPKCFQRNSFYAYSTAPRCVPVMPILPSKGGPQPPEGGLRKSDFVANIFRNSVSLKKKKKSGRKVSEKEEKTLLGENWGRRRRKKKSVFGAVARVATSAKKKVTKVSKTVTKKVAKVAKAVAKVTGPMLMKLAKKFIITKVLLRFAKGTPLQQAWRGLGMKGVIAFFDPRNAGRRISALRDALLYNPDSPIVARHTVYWLLDFKSMGGGLFGSLGLDCVFKMYFSSMLTANSYVRIEQRSATRPTLDGKDYKEGYEGLIQDGPLEISVFKCPGTYRNQTLGQQSNFAKQNDECKQHGKKQPPLCEARFKFDYHFCHEFENGVDCYKENASPGEEPGTMVRKAIHSELVTDAKTKVSECRAWFLLIDSGFRVGFSSIVTIQTAWEMRRCLMEQKKDKKVTLCIPGQEGIGERTCVSKRTR